MRWTQEQLDAYIAQIYRPVDDIDLPDEGAESVLQSKIERHCKEHGWPCLSFRQSKKAKVFLPAGWPDMEILLSGGKTLRLELKSAEGRLSDAQKRLRLQFLALGHTLHRVTSFKRFLELIRG